MSKHHHSSFSREVQDLLKAVEDTDLSGWNRDFGIDRQDDGTIIDNIDNAIYPNLLNWVTATIERDQTSYELDMEHSKGKFDDEY